jgi:hypothetical protein
MTCDLGDQLESSVVSFDLAKNLRNYVKLFFSVINALKPGSITKVNPAPKVAFKKVASPV